MIKSQYIVASAGTGKTESLATQIENLIVNEKVDITQIALITFTNKATKEMRERLRDKLYARWEQGFDVRDQLDKINMAKISTIHIFCDEIIREYGLVMGISPNYKITSFSHETSAIIDAVIEQNYDKEICSQIPTYRIKDLLKNLYNEAKDKGITITEPRTTIQGDFWDTFRTYFYKLYKQANEQIEQAKREKNILTSNDLLYYAAKLVENKEIAKQISNKIKYLFVDECQDINYDQMRIFEELLAYLTLIIVGDEKQSVYAFRGSDKVAFQTLIKRMQEKGATKTIADVNYRSNDELITKINKIFNSKFYVGKSRLNFDNISLKINGKKAKNKEVLEIQYGEKIEEIIKKLAVRFENGENPCYNEIVVLCRTNREVNSVVEKLKENGVPAEIYSSKSIYKSKAIIDLYKVLKYLITDGELEKHELFYTDYYLASLKYFNEKHLYEIVDGLKYEAKRESISFIINRLLEISKINDYYATIGKEQYTANLNRLKEIIRELSSQGMSTIQIVDYLNIMIDTQQVEQEPETITKAQIIVSTIHTYKGLSADAVVLYNADKNLLRENNSPYEIDEITQKVYFNKNVIIPSNNAIKEDKEFQVVANKKLFEDMEEELRLLYVACTRAREKLIIASNNVESKIKFIIKNNPNYVSYIRWVLESKVF